MSIKIKKFAEIGFSALLFCICVSFPARSQVTIGSNSNPLKGALLDLKEHDDVTGNYNSSSGVILPRVILTDVNSLSPMLTGSDLTDESLKPKYTGLTVYNVSVSTSFEKGLYIWDGAKWNKMSTSALKSIKAGNGLTAFDIDSVGLGGVLGKNTVIDLADFNLNFTRKSNGGKIGIGTSSPQAVLHIANPASEDPLILQNVKLVTSLQNSIDEPGPVYYDLKISENGVVRKVLPQVNSTNQSYGFDLNVNTTILPGVDALDGALGGGGSVLEWKPSTGTAVSSSIKLPEDGAYVFSFNLYGNFTVVDEGTSSDVNSFYICAFKGEEGDFSHLIDIAEIVVFHTPPAYTGWYALSYAINLTASGKMGEKIHFKISSFYPRRNRFTWTLEAGKTNMVYWRL